MLHLSDWQKNKSVTVASVSKDVDERELLVEV